MLVISPIVDLTSVVPKKKPTLDNHIWDFKNHVYGPAKRRLASQFFRTVATLYWVFGSGRFYTTSWSLPQRLKFPRRMSTFLGLFGPTPRPVTVEFVVGKVVLGQVFHANTLPIFHTHWLKYHWLYNLSNWWSRQITHACSVTSLIALNGSVASKTCTLSVQTLFT
jgi:hypothetical protein